MSATDGPIEVTVPALLAGVRLDRAVAMVADVSRAAAASLVAGGHVRVDGEAVTLGRSPLAEGAHLSIDRPEARGGLAPEPETAVVVVAADADVIVVDKPAGMVVHPGAGRRHGTLVAGLLAAYPDLGALGEAGVCDPERPGIVQRLDKGTSGLLVVARSARAYHSLVAQLSGRTVERRYVAMVAGHLAEDRGVIDAPIGRSARTPTKMAVRASGRHARTRYEVVGRLEEPQAATLLVVALETGRTHQIRVHLAAIGHPVLGDDRYGAAAGPERQTAAVRGPLARALAPGRLFLHAAVLGFDHPATGVRVRYVSALPAELAALSAPLVVADLAAPGGAGP